MSYFPTTHWSLVLNVGHGSVETAQRALEQLCHIYWYPLYSFARSQNDSAHDAEDLIQGFFAELVERNLVARAQIEKGRFRSFLLQSFKNYRYKQRDRRTAIKRGGQADIVSLDELQAEERFASEPTGGIAPDRQFERNWAISVLDEAHHRLAAEYEQAGKGDLFALLRGTLQSRGEGPAYAELAATVGKSEAAIKMDASRMRSQYRKRLREVVTETVSHPAEVEEELRYLLAVLSS